MSKSNDNIKFKGNKLTITGMAMKEGSSMPPFKLTKNDMSDLDSAEFKGKTLIISTLPSLDTPTCSLQTKQFNQAAEELGDGVRVLTVSLDLPFAQSRWCAAENCKRVLTASAYKHRDFGKSFGVWIEEWALLARAVFVVDKSGKVVLTQYVDDISQEPDYSEVLAKVNQIK